MDEGVAGDAGVDRFYVAQVGVGVLGVDGIQEDEARVAGEMGGIDYLAPYVGGVEGSGDGMVLGLKSS